MPSIAVLHLVRRKNGIAPLERFLASYLQQPAGQPHELVMLFKGFPRGIGLADYERLLSTIPHRRLFVPDRGRDLNAYFTAVEQLDYTYFCFMNSYSRILAPDWLAKLHRWISVDGVGLVGATGSCERFGDAKAVHRQQPHALAPAYRSEGLMRRVLAKWRQGILLRHAAFWLWWHAAFWLRRMVGIWGPARNFPDFPNYHLRTNAFMVARQTLRRLRPGAILTKLSAYKFESGNDSLTNQVRRLGLRVLVVGRDGEGYEAERWHLSNTFRQSSQENLLVADNQTDAYEMGNIEERAHLSGLAWGALARPV